MKTAVSEMKDTLREAAGKGELAGGMIAEDRQWELGKVKHKKRLKANRATGLQVTSDVCDSCPKGGERGLKSYLKK